MPINNRLTNPGRPLTSEYFGGESDTLREIPTEFRAACELRIVEIPLPWDDPLIPLSDPVLASKAEQKVTSERIRRTTYKQFGPVALHEVYTSKDKQLGNRTRTMRFQGDTIASPGPFRSVETKDLGNKHFIENVEDDGSLFSGATSTKEIPDVLPPMFKATLPSFEFATDLTGNITVPQILGPGEWYRSETQTDVFNMRRTTKSRGAVSYPVSISESKMAPDKQVETIVNKLDMGLQVLVPTPTMVEGEVQNLGDGSSIMKTGSTPVVFGGKTSIKEIPDTIPPEFRAAVPMYERELTFTGTVTDPQILGVGELYRKEQQLDVFNMRQTVRSIGAPTLPITLTEYKLTPEQQLATVTKKLDLGLQTLVPTPTMVGGEVVNLGNGTSILKTEVVPVVFSHIKYELVFPDLIPAEFRASFPTLKVTQTLPGLAALPTPGIGDLALSDEQITDLTHRASISTRSSVSLPQIIIGQEVTEDYGGGVLNNIKTLDASGLVVDTGYNIVSSVVKPLGNGLDLKETRQLADVSWPTLTSIIWDDEMQSYSTEEEQVVPAGTTPTSGTGFNESIKAIDKWRSKRIRTSRNPGFALVTFQYAPFKFPGLAPSPNKVDYRRASSMLTKHTIATYWVTNVGGPPSVATDEIVYDTIVLNSINGGGNLEQVDDVLHDSAFFGGGYWFGATTPSYSQYTGWQTVFGTGAWIFTAGSATVTGSGTNFTGELHVGDVVGRYWGMGPAITIISIGSATTLTLSSPMPISGSSGVYVSRDLGSRWIGTSRVVGATVSPTNIPNLWKVQTKSVVMR